ncbi:hypothetical protein ILUMI_14047, partial [Ignelater luminosus]
VNVADIATRGKESLDFSAKSESFNGPSFVYASEDHRPHEVTKIEKAEDFSKNLEIKALRVLLNGCNLCRILRAKPRIPETGQLPSDRLTRPLRPFTYVGMDYFGPINVTIGRRREKRYGVLFTCLSIRADSERNFKNCFKREGSKTKSFIDTSDRRRTIGNSRPLTYVASHVGDPESSTSNNVLIGTSTILN